MQIVIDIPENKYKLIQEGEYCGLLDKDLYQNIKCGISLDDVKAEISENICLTDNPYTKETNYTIEHLKLLEILNNIGKAESEVKE